MTLQSPPGHQKRAGKHKAPKATLTPRKRGGRAGVHLYTEELAEEICDRLAAGESLREICRDAHMPDEKAVRLWVIDRPDTFAPRYTRAREFGCDSLAEQVIAISDTECMGPDGYVDNGAVQRARLQAESRKWFLSKAMPRKYGDKVTQELVGDPDRPIVNRIELVPVDPIIRPRARIEDSRSGDDC